MTAAAVWTNTARAEDKTAEAFMVMTLTRWSRGDEADGINGNGKRKVAKYEYLARRGKTGYLDILRIVDSPPPLKS